METINVYSAEFYDKTLFTAFIKSTYWRMNHNDLMWLCKECRHAIRRYLRYHSIRKRKYADGKCEFCGYARSIFLTQMVPNARVIGE